MIIILQYLGVILTTKYSLSSGLIIMPFDLIFVISEFNPSLKSGMPSEVLFKLIFVSDKFFAYGL